MQRHGWACFIISILVLFVFTHYHTRSGHRLVALTQAKVTHLRRLLAPLPAHSQQTPAFQPPALAPPFDHRPFPSSTPSLASNQLSGWAFGRAAALLILSAALILRARRVLRFGPTRASPVYTEAPCGTIVILTTSGGKPLGGAPDFAEFGHKLEEDLASFGNKLEVDLASFGNKLEADAKTMLEKLQRFLANPIPPMEPKQMMLLGSSAVGALLGFGLAVAHSMGVELPDLSHFAGFSGGGGIGDALKAAWLLLKHVIHMALRSVLQWLRLYATQSLSALRWAVLKPFLGPA